MFRHGRLDIISKSVIESEIVLQYTRVVDKRGIGKMFHTTANDAGHKSE